MARPGVRRRPDTPLDPARARRIAEQIDSAREALRVGGLGERGLDPADVLLSGGQGRGEFVQLVGLGLGHQQQLAPRPSSAAQLLGSRIEPPEKRRPRRRWWPATAIVATVALVAAAVTIAVGSGAPAEPPLAPGQVAVMRGSDKAIRSIATTTMDGRPVVAVRGHDQLVRVYDLARGVQLGDPRGTPGRLAKPRWSPRPIEVAQVGNRPVLIGLDRTAARVNFTLQLGLRSYPLPDGPVGPISVPDGESYTLAAATTLDH